MRTGVFLFGGVEMPDAGAGPPVPTDRRYDHKEVWRTTERIIDMGVVCDRLGFDSIWLAEHHFQHEGYEVIPNGAEAISWRDEHIGLENLLLFPAMPGDSYEKVEEQLHRIAQDVLPLLPSN